MRIRSDKDFRSNFIWFLVATGSFQYMFPSQLLSHSAPMLNNVDLSFRRQRKLNAFGVWIRLIQWTRPGSRRHYSL